MTVAKRVRLDAFLEVREDLGRRSTLLGYPFLQKPLLEIRRDRAKGGPVWEVRQVPGNDVDDVVAEGADLLGGPRANGGVRCHRCPLLRVPGDRGLPTVTCRAPAGSPET